MTAKKRELAVTSHVGRDLLAAAASFKTEAAVVWEYVVNSLQYVRTGVAPSVSVAVEPSSRRIVVSDNGRGMNSQGLQHYFKMHGENLDRLAGRPGRGKFGTGKSAAFGIARSLTLDTVRDGKRNTVRLTREAIDSSNGEDIPIDWLTREENTSDPDGTTVVIADIVLPKLRWAPIVEYIERHLQAFRSVNPQVAVNNHVCTYREPHVAEEYEFEPNSKQEQVLGKVLLRIKVAKAPLSESEQGVSVTAGPGNLVGIEKGGLESKEFGSYLFGEIDVPPLEDAGGVVAPYDSSRSLQLNPLHPVVAVLIGFIGSKLEKVRLDLVKKAQEARKTEQMRRLADQADRIAEVLNADFAKIRQRLNDIRSAATRHGGQPASAGRSEDGGDQTSNWTEGTERPGRTKTTGKGGGGAGGKGRNAPGLTRSGEPDDTGNTAVDPAGGDDGRRTRSRGGFKVEYGNLGKDQDRSHYDLPRLTILINLDHPVLAAALQRGSVEDPAFRRLSYEVAFAEYSLGIGYHTSQQDPDIPADDLLYEVRSTLNRISASAASLYY